MLNPKSNFQKLAIAIKLSFLLLLIVFQNAHADNNPSVIHLEIPNVAWWSKVANSQFLSDTHFNVNQNLSGLKTLAQVRERMIKAVSNPIQIAIQKSDEVNAFARHEAGYSLIIFTSGFIKQFGHDADVLANTLGHEMAHHTLGHIDSKSEVVSLINNESNIIPKEKHLEAKAIRANELAADNAGIQFAMNAGYSACGAYRLFSYLQNNQISYSGPQSSHPIISDRLDLANTLNIKTQKGSCS